MSHLFNDGPSPQSQECLGIGRWNRILELETSQLALMDQLGTAAADKKHVVYQAGHVIPQEPMVRETLAWFDHYLSGLPVKK